MITVHILEPNDILEATDWCRPLQIVSMSGGHSDYYSFQNQYSGTPENNAEWCRVKSVIGKPWIGKPVGDYMAGMKELGLRWEFVRGDIPKSHQLNMKGYNDFSKNKIRYPDEEQEYDDDIPF